MLVCFWFAGERKIRCDTEKVCPTRGNDPLCLRSASPRRPARHAAAGVTLPWGLPGA